MPINPRVKENLTYGGRVCIYPLKITVPVYIYRFEKQQIVECKIKE